MKKLIFSLLLIVLSTAKAEAQDAVTSMPADFKIMSPETQNYTYAVKEDGSAQVWMRADSITVPKAGGEYKFTLPDKTKGEVKAWFREYGCAQYRGEMCLYYGQGEWKELKFNQNGREIAAVIPEVKLPEKVQRQPLSVGITYTMENVTVPKWWGREVKIVTGKASAMVSYLNIGVYMPDGVYVRDMQMGPKGWGMAMTTMMVARDSSAVNEKMAQMPTSMPTMFDYAGGGEINRSRPNLVPGEEYTFSFMSSTSAWKLYTKEISFGAGWIAAIAIVVSMLLYMVVGKKPLRWYLGVMILLTLLFILIGGLWLSYRSTVAGGIYPYGRGGVMMKTLDSNISVPPNPATGEPAQVEIAPADTAEPAAK